MRWRRHFDFEQQPAGGDHNTRSSDGNANARAVNSGQHYHQQYRADVWLELLRHMRRRRNDLIFHDTGAHLSAAGDDALFHRIESYGRIEYYGSGNALGPRSMVEPSWN